MEKEQLLEHIQHVIEKQHQQPIFEILMLEKTGEKPIIYPTGKDSGFPDTGTTDVPGFYYNLDDAIHAMHVNSCDLREYVYQAGFILCRFPGLYRSVGKDLRMYFLWDESRNGYFETEEPKSFAHIAY